MPDVPLLFLAGKQGTGGTMQGRLGEGEGVEGPLMDNR